MVRYSNKKKSRCNIIQFGNIANFFFDPPVVESHFTSTWRITFHIWYRGSTFLCSYKMIIFRLGFYKIQNGE